MYYTYIIYPSIFCGCLMVMHPARQVPQQPAPTLALRARGGRLRLLGSCDLLLREHAGHGPTAALEHLEVIWLVYGSSMDNLELIYG